MFTHQLRTSTPASISNIMIFAAILTVSCMAMALPVSNSATSKHDLNNLMSLLGKLKDAQRLRHNVLDAASASSSNHRPGKTSSSLDAAILLQRAAAVADDFDTDMDDDDVDEADTSSDRLNKRQGAWSYDYGLGGGRFGKRGYAEYGLGGGRFGRDVDHVDPHHDADIDADSVDVL